MKGNYGSAYDVFAGNYYYKVSYLDEPTKSYQLMRVDLDVRAMKLDLSSSAPKVEKGQKVEL